MTIARRYLSSLNTHSLKFTTSATNNAHNGSIWAVSWEGEGDHSTIATGSTDPKAPIKLWSFDEKTSTPTCKHIITGHILAVSSLALTNGAKTLVSCSLDNTVKIWNLSEEKPSLTKSFDFDPLASWDCCASPTNDMIGVCGMNSLSAVFTTSASVSKLAAEPKFYQCLSFNGDGSQFCCGVSNGDVCLYDINKQEFTTVLPLHNKAVRGVKFLQNGLLLSAGEDGRIVLSDPRGPTFQQQCVYNFIGHNDIVFKAVPLDDNYFVSCSSDATVKLWDIRERRVLQTFTDHKGMALNVCCNASGNAFASVGEEGELVIGAQRKSDIL